MKRILGIVVILLLAQTSAWATWSIVAVDRNTGRVVISSSTCAATASPENLKQLQAVVIPGIGVAACQAGVDGTHKNHTLVFEEMKKGTDPKEIIIKHFIDSLAALAATNFAQGCRVLDVGSGGGFPGIPRLLPWGDR